MKTWLLTWNPTAWAWNDPLYGFNELRNEIKQNSFTYSKWTCGVNKSINVGDRVFVIRLSDAMRGIVASGYAASNVFEGTHWNINKANEGKKAKRILIKFDKITNIDENEILSYEELHKIDGTYHWSPQCSGVGIPNDIAKKLEEIWKKK